MKYANLIINDIGPIKHIALQGNKINVIIGPQGSGKSTIAKIISYCTWVEKQIFTHLEPEAFTRPDAFYEELITFHNLHGYFNNDSFIKYESEFIQIEYQHKKRQPNIVLKHNQSPYQRAKITYIPAERNLVAAIPNWLEVKLPQNNIRNFMIEWEQARKQRTNLHPLSLFNDTIHYIYDPDKGDIVLTAQGPLNLSDTASGFQSIIPLFAVVEHALQAKNDSKQNESIQQSQDRNELLNKILRTLNNNLDLATFYQTILSDINNKDIKHSDLIKQFAFANFLANSFMQTQRVKIIIEEIEQNLFPETQCDAIYKLLSQITNDNDTLVLTTHSPYVLYALNNCILGGLVNSQIPQDQHIQFQSSRAWINPSTISIWQITKNGTLSTIQDPNSHLLKPHYFNSIITELMNEYYHLLNYYLKNKNEK